MNQANIQQGIPDTLSSGIINNYLKQLGRGWLINNQGHLYKKFKFNNFVDAMSFANQIAEIAEYEAHHPHLNITWGICAVEVWTHDAGGLTSKDFILALKIEDLE